MRNYVRKYTTCLICGKGIKRGKYCPRDKTEGYRRRNRDYQRQYYKKIMKKKSKTWSHVIRGKTLIKKQSKLIATSKPGEGIIPFINRADKIRKEIK